MEDFSGYSSFNYLAEDNMLANFCQLAENILNALPKNESTRVITEQFKKFKQTKEKWSYKIFQTCLNRIIPMFTKEAILKLIQGSYQVSKVHLVSIRYHLETTFSRK